ncbi:hypothetical protein EDD85DRAFT_864016, partial [Armillaria nabsnona]
MDGRVFFLIVFCTSLYSFIVPLIIKYVRRALPCASYTSLLLWPAAIGINVAVVV